ncbi:MAG: WXG100 family type VII secretion target [Bacteroidales bacterium]|nr:WXG100 family type VII secretion target [Bacteroidales bacterium]MCM1416365.1 WXG100 family type VII secretion target [bacterium]MCM1422640.1 WXG100 family type VII secretion target [bacterium]
MANGIAVTYDIMDQVSNELTSIVNEIVTNKATMMEKVNYLCETWQSEASRTHQEEFMSVGKNIDTLTQLADELVSSIKKYRADMEQLDQSYA